MNLLRRLMNLWAVLAAISKSHFRSKIGVFFSFLFPVMLLLIFGFIFSGMESTKYTLHIQNLDLDPATGQPTNLSSAFIESLEATGTFTIENLAPGKNLTAFVRENPSFDDYRILRIPKGFQDRSFNRSFLIRLIIINSTMDQFLTYGGDEMNMSQREQMNQSQAGLEEGISALSQNTTAIDIELFTNPEDQGGGIIRGIVSSIVDGFNKNLIGAEPIIELESMKLTERSLAVTDYFIPGFFAAFIMTNGVIGVTATVSEYRRNGIVKRLAATPLGKASWIIGNVLFQTILAFTLLVVMIGLGFALFEFDVLPDAVALFFTFIGAVAFCGIGMILGGVIKDVEAAVGAGNAIAFPMMYLSGAFWPLDMMPEFMQTVAKALPLYYYHEGLRQIMVYQNPQAALIPFLVMGMMAIICILLAIKVTKWKELD